MGFETVLQCMHLSQGNAKLTLLCLIAQSGVLIALKLTVIEQRTRKSEVCCGKYPLPYVSQELWC